MSEILISDADPFVPKGWKIEEHKKSGQLEWDPAKVQLYLSPNQKDGKWIEGNKLRQELADKPVLNANVLDYLLAHPQLIPEEWKEDDNGNIRYIFFWGTTYRDSAGDLCVRCLCFHVGQWHWGCHWLDYDWDDSYPAALLAS
jgi:hypothetical protein